MFKKEKKDRTNKKEFYNNIDKQVLCEVRRIVDLSVKVGLSQENIGDILGVTPASITAWYTGILTPSLKHYLALQYLKTLLVIIERIKNVK